MSPEAQKRVRDALARDAARAAAVAEAQPKPDPIPTEIKLTVWGHARPSKRITKNMVHTETAQGYLRWQEEVAKACIEVKPRPLPWSHFQVDIVAYFVPPANEDAPGFADRINMGKAVEDGLARGGVFPTYHGKPNDSRIRWGNVGILYCKLKKRERVEITVRPFVMPEPVD